MEHFPLISVIVPVYKVEEYLDKCIRSIVNQSYQNLEIVLVDDGSPDNCGRLCDAWAVRDTRITVIHKDNGGLSDARNAGMRIATGEYIGFVDSDDWIEPNMYQLLYEHMQKTGSDISICGTRMDFASGRAPEMLTMSGNAVYSTEDALAEVIEERGILHPVWNKLYRIENIRDILFPVGKWHEDAYWTYKAIAKAKRICVFETPCYHYYQRSDSIMGAPFSAKRLDRLDAERELVEFIHTQYPKLENMARIKLLSSCLYIMQGAIQSLKWNESKSVRRHICHLAAWSAPHLWNSNLAIKKKIMLVSARISLEGTAAMLNYLIKVGILS